MQGTRLTRSILLADIGAVFTHTALVERAAGAYRLAACTDTLTERDAGARPAVDLSASLVRGVEQLQALVRRPLLDGHGVPVRPRAGDAGVDVLAVTASAGDPLRCALVGITGHRSLQAGYLACARAGALVTGAVELIAGRATRHEGLVRLRQGVPDVVVMLGGLDAGPATPLVAAAGMLAALYAGMPRHERPVIIFAGNVEARRPIGAALGDGFEYRVVENLFSAHEGGGPAELERDLAGLYTSHRLPRLAGHADLCAWAGAPPLASNAGLQTVLAFLSRQGRYGRQVLGLDVGAETTVVALAGDPAAALIAANRGTGGGLDTLLEERPQRRLLRWLPTADAASRAAGLLRNRTLRAAGLPEDEAERAVLLAAAHEALAGPLARLEAGHPGALARVDLIAARGSVFAHAGSDATVLLTLLDAVQPRGQSRVVLDWASVWPQLGALARTEPVAALQVLERDALRDLGTAVSVTGRVPRRALSLHRRPRPPAVRLRLAREGDVTEAEVRAGELRRLPLGTGAATLEAWPARGVDLGLQRPGEPVQVAVYGGSVGLVVDARGRPLPVAGEPTARFREVQAWQSGL